jgi:hypothetical protein
MRAAQLMIELMIAAVFQHLHIAITPLSGYAAYAVQGRKGRKGRGRAGRYGNRNDG